MTATEARQLLASAKRPWDAKAGIPRYPRIICPEQQKMIDICLSCPLPKCTNCFRYKTYRFSYLAKMEAKR